MNRWKKSWALIALLGLLAFDWAEAELTPKETAIKVLRMTKNILTTDYKTFCAYTTKDSHELIRGLQEVYENLGLRDRRLLEQKIAITKGGLEEDSIQCQEQGETAICTVCCLPDSDEVATMHLEKHDGKWLVNLEL